MAEEKAAGGSSPARSTLIVSCPDCDCEMQIDSQTGHVLSHTRAGKPEKKAGRNDFDALLARVDDAKKRASALFDQEMEAHNDRDRLLDEKFRRALDRAEREGASEGGEAKPPKRPWDFD